MKEHSEGKLKKRKTYHNSPLCLPFSNAAHGDTQHLEVVSGGEKNGSTKAACLPPNHLSRKDIQNFWNKSTVEEAEALDKKHLAIQLAANISGCLEIIRNRTPTQVIRQCCIRLLSEVPPEPEVTLVGLHLWLADSHARPPSSPGRGLQNASDIMTGS